MTWTIAVDIGGTFTDLFAYDDATGVVKQGKSSTTPSNLVNGIKDCIRKSGLNISEASSFIHGSTTAINTVIERKGAQTALVVTEGTRDVYLIGRGNRPEAYNILFKRPEPLVRRNRIYEVRERFLADGTVQTPLDKENAREVAKTIAQSGANSVAVCFLHSYQNPTHEMEMAKILREELPNCYISLSHEILREYREYERTSTTVVNSYVGPRVSKYILDLEQSLRSIGFPGTLLMMESNGGVMLPSVASKKPVMMMESGPVGGIIAASYVSSNLGFKNSIAFDMGGTTAKTSLIKDGQVAMSDGYYVGGYATGHPVMIPVVDIVEVGAGGGSIASIDEVGRLKVGPKSAGADPGPMCYGLGGTEPTITDANVVLNRIDPSRFLGGEMLLDKSKAVAGVRDKIAKPLGIETEEAALGILRIASTLMSLAVREISIAKGYDPRDFPMVAFGGGGPTHAVEIARDLHIPTVIVPNLPAHFSAIGMVLTDIRHDYVRTYYKPLAESDFGEIAKIFEEMENGGEETLESERVPAEAMVFSRLLDMRYIGQEFTLSVPVDFEDIARSNPSEIKKKFDATYKRRFGQSADDPVELVNLRLVAIGKRQKSNVRVKQEREVKVSESFVGRRSAYLHGSKPVECPVYKRELMHEGETIKGPAIIEEYASTTPIFEGDSAKIAGSGEIIITVSPESK